MSKVMMATDWHFGKSNGKFDEIIAEGIRQLCAYATEHDIKVLFNLGDTFDMKQIISVSTLNVIAESFELLNNTFDNIYILVGNHDMSKKIFSGEGHNINILEAYPNVKLVESPEVISVYEKDFFAVPYLPNELFSTIKFPDADYCLGHFEVKGFFLNSFVQSDEGIENEAVLEKYDRVYLGHFHKRQKKGNIEYIGNLCRFFYGENDEPRGYLVLDTAKNKNKFIEYDHPCLYRLKMSDFAENENLIETIKKGDKIKLIIDKRAEYSEIEKLKNTLILDYGVSELLIEEQYFSFDLDELDDEDENMDVETKKKIDDQSYFDFLYHELKKQGGYSEDSVKYIENKIKTFQ